MIEFYPQIKLLHIVLVLASGAIFIVRGGAAVFGARWPYASWLKWSSATLDTFLLTSAAMLATILPRAMFANGWLTVKLGLLVVYIMGSKVVGEFMPRTSVRGDGAIDHATDKFSQIPLRATVLTPTGSLTEHHWIGAGFGTTSAKGA